MRICMILEGSYPYTFGGVSSWAHNLIRSMPQHEFVLWVIGAKAESKGKFKYELPENVKEVCEVFLDDALKDSTGGKDKVKLTEGEKEALFQFLDGGKPDWDELFSLFQEKNCDPTDLLMSGEFLDILTDLCNRKYPYAPFADTFHTMRSMLLTVLHILRSEVPEADIYHSICTGYGGLLGALGNYKTGKPLILTEHGIYTREREEEIIRAEWVMPAFKKQWISFFYMLSGAIYSKATIITSLFGNASRIQQELGAPKDKCRVIPNGINYERFCEIPLKKDDGFIDIGAVIRMAQIKDVKTLIYAFHELSSMRENVRLHILGGVDDETYAKECYDLVEQLGIKNLTFPGQVDVVKYMEQLDFTVLTSLSEGQPLSVLESFAAGRPVVTTDVGCCRQLILGEDGDDLGQAGYYVPPMHREGLARAMNRMCSDKENMIRMGEIGKKRVEKYYRSPMMLSRYDACYREVSGWQE